MIELNSRGAPAAVKELPVPSASRSVKAGDDFRALMERQRALMSSSRLDGRALIEYQVAVSALTSRVELVSRVAESAVATMRRLQNGV